MGVCCLFACQSVLSLVAKFGQPLWNGLAPSRLVDLNQHEPEHAAGTAGAANDASIGAVALSYKMVH
eukprot:87239-Amphidinium_carterae.1